MVRPPAQYRVQSAGCVLDWDRRGGFVKESEILGLGSRGHFYAIGYRPRGKLTGPLAYASINPTAHFSTLSRMPRDAGSDLIELDAIVREALGFDPDDDLVTNSNIAANIGGAAAGTTIKGHLHLITVGAYAQKPHSAMGLMALRCMYDRLYSFTDDMVADLDALSRSGATAEVYDEHVEYWKEQLRLLKQEKRRADAYKRKR
jgi:hypothetical protein